MGIERARTAMLAHRAHPVGRLALDGDKARVRICRLQLAVQRRQGHILEHIERLESRPQHVDDPRTLRLEPCYLRFVIDAADMGQRPADAQPRVMKELSRALRAAAVEADKKDLGHRNFLVARPTGRRCV
jgi:hypothetical protein